eukprot:g3540.t1
MAAPRGELGAKMMGLQRNSGKEKTDKELGIMYNQFDPNAMGYIDKLNASKLVAVVAKSVGVRMNRRMCDIAAKEMDDENTDVIKFGSFLKWYRRTYPSKVEDVVGQIQYEFRVFDVDKTGGLSESEISNLIDYMGLSKPGLTSESIASSIPKSRNGDIRFEDFLDWHMKSYPEEYQFSKQQPIQRKDTDEETKTINHEDLGLVETQYTKGSQVEVYFRGRKMWYPGELLEINERKGIAHFHSYHGNHVKWVQLSNSSRSTSKAC